MANLDELPLVAGEQAAQSREFRAYRRGGRWLRRLVGAVDLVAEVSIFLIAGAISYRVAYALTPDAWFEVTGSIRGSARELAEQDVVALVLLPARLVGQLGMMATTLLLVACILVHNVATPWAKTLLPASFAYWYKHAPVRLNLNGSMQLAAALAARAKLRRRHFAHALGDTIGLGASGAIVGVGVVLLLALAISLLRVQAHWLGSSGWGVATAWVVWLLSLGALALAWHLGLKLGSRITFRITQLAGGVTRESDGATGRVNGIAKNRQEK